MQVKTHLDINREVVSLTWIGCGLITDVSEPPAITTLVIQTRI